MAQVTIAVFSGTGNARRASGVIAEAFTQAGAEVDTVDLAAGGSVPALAPGELLILCSSTLGFSPPSTVMERLKAAPRSPGAKAAVLCVCGGIVHKGRISGGWSGAASLTAFSVLRRKGFEPVGSADASYPENWTQVSEAATGADREAVIARGDAEALAFARATLAAYPSGKGTFLRRNALTLTLGRFVGFVFRLAARRILGGMYIADDSCTSCGLCARTCPAAAIVMSGGAPTWTARCSDCNRCINLCPTASIQTSTARLVIFSAVNIAAMAVSPAIARGVLRSLAPSFSGGLLRPAAFLVGVALYAAITALQLGPLSALVNRLERKPACRPFFTASFTKRFARYLAPGFKPAERA